MFERNTRAALRARRSSYPSAEAAVAGQRDDESLVPVAQRRPGSSTGRPTRTSAQPTSTSADFDVSSWREIAGAQQLAAAGLRRAALHEHSLSVQGRSAAGDGRTAASNFTELSPSAIRSAAIAARSSCPDDWHGRQVFLQFDGVDSAFYVWVNGQRSATARTAARRPCSTSPSTSSRARTDLAVEVYRYCDGSYLEDQDYWRLSGIYRDVFLWSAADLISATSSCTPTSTSDYRDATLTWRWR